MWTPSTGNIGNTGSPNYQPERMALFPRRRKRKRRKEKEKEKVVPPFFFICHEAFALCMRSSK